MRLHDGRLAGERTRGVGEHLQDQTLERQRGRNVGLVEFAVQSRPECSEPRRSRERWRRGDAGELLDVLGVSGEDLDQETSPTRSSEDVGMWFGGGLEHHRSHLAFLLASARPLGVETGYEEAD